MTDLKKYTIYLRQEQLEFLRETQNNISLHIRELIDADMEKQSLSTLPKSDKIISLILQIEKIERDFYRIRDNPSYEHAKQMVKKYESNPDPQLKRDYEFRKKVVKAFKEKLDHLNKKAAELRKQIMEI